MTPFTAFALCFISGIAGTTTLVIYGHPWFASFVLLVTACLSMSSKKGDDPK